jgi:hypothetical protein
VLIIARLPGQAGRLRYFGGGSAAKAAQASRLTGITGNPGRTFPDKQDGQRSIQAQKRENAGMKIAILGH